MTQYAKYLSSSVKLSSTNIITPVTMQRPDYFILNFKTFIKVATITFIFLCLKLLKSLERFFFWSLSCLNKLHGHVLMEK